VIRLDFQDSQDPTTRPFWRIRSDRKPKRSQGTGRPIQETRRKTLVLRDREPFPIISRLRGPKKWNTLSLKSLKHVSFDLDNIFVGEASFLRDACDARKQGSVYILPSEKNAAMRFNCPNNSRQIRSRLDFTCSWHDSAPC
jgi:hypothetical protein